MDNLGDMDAQSFDFGYQDIGTDAVKGLSEGADEVYGRLRQMETDTVSQSDESKDAIVPISSALPLLVQPFTTTAEFDNWAKHAMKSGRVDGAGGSTDYQKWAEESLGANFKAVAIGVLDDWVEAEGKRADAQREESKKLDIEAYAEYMDQIKMTSTGDFLNTHTLQAAFIVGAGLTSMIGGTQALTDANKVAFDAIQNSINHVGQMIPSDMRAELGLLGAMFANAATFQATMLTVGGSENAEGRSMARQFAANYADRVIKMTTDEKFEGLLKTAIQANAPGEGRISEGKMQEHLSQAKIGLLMTGLALFYKEEMGGMSGAEVASLVRDADLAHAGAKAPLIDGIRQNLERLSPEAQVKVLEGIMAYIDSKPKVESMMDPMQVLANLFRGMEEEGTKGNIARAA